MSGRATAAGLVGAAAGAALAVLTLLLELAARDLPLRGGLWQLQTGSVAVWVVESLPLLLAAAMVAVTRARAPVEADRPPPPPELEAPVTPPSPGAPSLPAPPPLPVGLSGGQILGVQASDARIAALQELVRAVRERAEKAEEESRAKSRTVSRLADVLRGPLSDILGRAELLEEEDLDARQLHEVRRLTLSARALTSTVSDLIDLSKLEVGALSLVVQEVDLERILDEVRPMASTAAEVQRDRYDAEIPTEARFVRGDHGRVRQAVLGLLDHAFRGTRGGAVTVRAERVDEGGRFVAVRVRGAGLRPDEVEEALEGLDPAAGIGVVLARKLAEVMGGRLEAAPSPGAGTTFTLLLPRADDRARPPTPATIPPDERLRGLHVLVVDADPGGVSVVRALERTGVQATLVADLRSASVAADAEDTRLALVDVGMPGAWSLVEDLVAAQVKVIATSLRDEDLEQALERGVSAFLVRPLDRALLLATLSRCLDQ